MSRARDTAGIIQYNHLTIDSNNAVGIGSSMPDTKFDINGGLRVTGIGTFENDVQIADKIVHTGDTNTAIRFPAADTFTVETAGSEALRVDSSQRVLIGTNSNLSASANRFLQVSDSAPFVIFHSNTNNPTADNTLAGLEYGGQGGGSYVPGAFIRAQTDGNWGSSDCPTRLTFSVTADGASSPTERLRITSAGNVSIQNDSGKFTAGTSDDLEIYHDGTHSNIENNTGELRLRSDDLRLQNNLATENYLTGAANGAVTVYYDNSAKLVTKTDGIDVTGEVQCDSLDVDGAADITGNVTLHANLDLQDNDKILIGTGDDLQIYHTVTYSLIENNTGYFKQTAKNGIFYLQSDDQVLITSNNATENFAKFFKDGAVELYYDNSKKLETKSDGVLISGELECDTLDVQGNLDIHATRISYDTTSERLKFLDNIKLVFGTGDDLQIYHDGSNSYIKENGTGGLIIETTGGNTDLKFGSEYLARFKSNGAVELYYDNSKKLETKSDGVDITGELQSDSLDVDGVANIQGVITAQAGAVAEIGTLTDAATVTPDLATHCNFTITLGGNRTLANPSNIVAGQSGSIFVVQDGTGSRSFNSFGSYWDFIGGTVPTFTSTAGAVDRIDYIVRSSTKIHAVFTANYS